MSMIMTLTRIGCFIGANGRAASTGRNGDGETTTGAAGKETGIRIQNKTRHSFSTIAYDTIRRTTRNKTYTHLPYGLRFSRKNVSLNKAKEWTNTVHGVGGYSRRIIEDNFMQRDLPPFAPGSPIYGSRLELHDRLVRYPYNHPPPALNHHPV